MRNQHNLIYKLTQSPIFQTAHDDFVDERTANDTAQYEERVSVHLATFNRQIRGLIFQLVAIDFTVAMNEGHVRTAEDYLTVLLSTNEEQSQAILWSLMYNSISASLEIKTPEYRNFEMSRVDDVLRSCMRSDFSGVQEYDVEMVHFVLNEEISSVANCDINDIKRVSLIFCKNSKLIDCFRKRMRFFFIAFNTMLRNDLKDRVYKCCQHGLLLSMELCSLLRCHLLIWVSNLKLCLNVMTCF